MATNAPTGLAFPQVQRDWIDRYLPPITAPPNDLPYLTLTYAASLDSALTAIPGQQTWISGPQSTAMTHFLRSKHDAILIGVGTAIAANPSLNCRLSGVKKDEQPRPVIVDPSGRWDLDENNLSVLKALKEDTGRAPWIVTARTPSARAAELLTRLGGEFIRLDVDEATNQIPWTAILRSLSERRVQSVMVEGGAHVINTLLGPDHKHLVHTVIVTVAPLWLGPGTVSVSPSRRGTDPQRTIARLRDITWHQLGDDAVLCANIQRDDQP